MDKIDKRKLLVILAIAAALALAVWLLFFHKTAPPQPSQEEITKKQLEELNILRNPDKLNPTEEELSQQAKELDKLNTGSNPSSQEEINNQLEELDKLKGQ